MKYTQKYLKNNIYQPNQNKIEIIKCNSVTAPSKGNPYHVYPINNLSPISPPFYQEKPAKSTRKFQPPKTSAASASIKTPFIWVPYFHIISKGTMNSKVYIYNISIDKQNLNDDDGFLLKEIKVITPHCKVVSLIKANEKYFVTVPETDEQCFISVWSAENQNFLVCFQGHRSQISSIVFMQNQKYLASSSWDGSILIWDLDQLLSLKPYKIYKGNYPILMMKQFNDESLIFGGDDCYLVLWNWQKNEIIKKEFGHAGSVTHVEVMSQYVFTTGGDNKFRFWEVLVSQSIQNSSHQSSSDHRQKYKIKKIAQIKQQYDSIVYGTCYDDYLIIVDRRGEVYLFTQDTEMHKFGNFFDQNEEISGIDVYEDFIIVTTTKGVLKHLNIKDEFNKIPQSKKTKKTILSPTNQMQILGQQENEPSKNSSQRNNDNDQQNCEVVSINLRTKDDIKKESSKINPNE